MLKRLQVPTNLLRTPIRRSLPTAPAFCRFLLTGKNETRKQDTVKVKKELIPQIQTILALEPNGENSQRWLHTVLGKALKESPAPHRMYEEVVSFLVRNRRHEHAYTVFERMQKAGYEPSNQVVTQMLAPLLTSSTHSPVEVAQEIVELFLDPGYTDHHLCTLLQVFSAFDVDKGIVASIVDTYRSVQGPEYIPSPSVLSNIVNSAARLGRIEEAFDMLARGSEKTRAVVDRNHIFYAFIGLLETLRATRTNDTHSMARVIDLMTTRGWLVNIKIFDVLISREVRAGSPRVALAIYYMLKELSKTQTHIRPSAHTFGSLFALYRRLEPKTYRKMYTPASPIYLPLRQIFREFNELATRKTDPLVTSTAVLNAALRAFMRQRDYAGALVVLDSFARYSVTLDHRTYHSIMKVLIRRIWFEVSGKRKGKHGEVRWADRFLGVPYKDVELCVPLVNHILFLVSRETFKVTDPMYPPEGRFREVGEEGGYKVPTILMMEHKYRPDPWNFEYHPVPLRRLLHRAILADYSTEAPAASSAMAAIAGAKADMF